LFAITYLILAVRGELGGWAYWVLSGIALYGSMLLAVWRLGMVKYRCGWDALGFRSLDLRRALILAAKVIGAALVINVIYGALIHYFGLWPLEPDPFPERYTEEGLSLAALGFLALIAAPVAEETFFRGFVFPGMGKRFGYGWGAMLSALLFALSHFDPGALVPIFFLGLLLVWLYVKTRSVWACILAHSLYNSIALIFVII